jgi:ribosomal protein L22
MKSVLDGGFDPSRRSFRADGRGNKREASSREIAIVVVDTSVTFTLYYV